MKQLILFTILTILCNQGFSQNDLSYDDLKTGKFIYEGKDVEIIRTKRRQIEIYNEGKSKLILKIKWVNDSTYVLTLKKSINSPGCLSKGDTITSTILSRKGNKYKCSYKSNKCGEGRSVFIKLE